MGMKFKNQVKYKRRKTFLYLGLITFSLIVLFGIVNLAIPNLYQKLEATILQKNTQQASEAASGQYYGQIAGVESKQSSFSATTDDIDPRAYVLNQYFKKHESPLQGTGEIFVEACERYGAPADCTTVAAIAKAETDLCNYYNSADYYNCWGFGGGGANRMYFNSWEESIDLVTDRLVNSYGNEYMIDPRRMERVFCGWEPGCTGWGNRVLYFMRDISNYSKDLGFEYTLYDLRKN